MSPILLRTFTEAVAGTYMVTNYASIKRSLKLEETMYDFEFRVMAAAPEEEKKEENDTCDQVENSLAAAQESSIELTMGTSEGAPKVSPLYSL